MQILLFQIEKEKEKEIGRICRRLQITVRKIVPKDYGQKLGYLAGITGFSREHAPYAGGAFPAEMLVFSGMDSGQVDLFLKESGEASAENGESGTEPVGLKAVLTEHNVFWTPAQLFAELLKEAHQIESGR